jgi:hypothetical protein
VIFYDISGFQRGGFLQIISIYIKSSDIWFLVHDIYKNRCKSQPQHTILPPI